MRFMNTAGHIRHAALSFAAICLLIAGGCDLNVDNPNALDEDTVFTTDQGLLALVVGMQDRFAENVDGFVQGSALVTDEWGTGTRSLSSYRALLTGELIDPESGVILEPWSGAYDVINLADQVLANAGNVGLSSGAATGVSAVAKTFKGMSFGILGSQFERVILNPDAESPTLSPAAAAIEEAITLLESARTDYGGLSAADRSYLTTRVLGAGFDLGSTIDAMLARYYLEVGDYTNAIAAANRVDLSVRSMLPYPAPDLNPICNLSECGLQYVFPLASFATQAEPGDGRVAYWVEAASPTFTGTPDSVLIPLARYSGRNEGYLTYVPDEMTLIRAEAQARLGNLQAARDLINEVRTRTTVEPIAGLPALSAAQLPTLGSILTQILYERRYELYEQGLRWSDVRRLSAYSALLPTIDRYPVPQSECRSNPSLGC